MSGGATTSVFAVELELAGEVNSAVVELATGHQAGKKYMPKAVKTAAEAARGPFEVSDFPDLIPDSTVAFAACKAVPEILDSKTILVH